MRRAGRSSIRRRRWCVTNGFEFLKREGADDDVPPVALSRREREDGWMFFYSLVGAAISGSVDAWCCGVVLEKGSFFVR